MDKSRADLLQEILEQFGGRGMGGGEAFYDFRHNYFTKVTNEDERASIIEILLRLVNDNRYDFSTRTKAAWICSDLGVGEVRERIAELMKDGRLWNPDAMRSVHSAHLLLLAYSLTHLNDAGSSNDMGHRSSPKDWKLAHHELKQKVKEMIDQGISASIGESGFDTPVRQKAEAALRKKISAFWAGFW